MPRDWWTAKSLPAEDPGGHCGERGEQDEQRRYVHPVRAPARSVPDALEERHGVRGRKQVRNRFERAGEPVDGIEQSRQSEHRVEHRRADRLRESRRRHYAGDYESEREDAERAQEYG